MTRPSRLASGLPDHLPVTTASDRLRGQSGGSMVRPATLSELFPERAVDGAATGFVLSHLAGRTGPILWVQDRLSRREAGRPYLAGMSSALPVLGIEVSHPRDVLWAMEEALGTSALAGVIGEIWGDPPVLSFTATKRLALRAETHGVPAWLVRRAATADLSAARERWRVASLPASADPDDARAPGAPVWQAELFRSRDGAPGSWVARPDARTGRIQFDHARAGQPPRRRQVG